MRVIAGIYRSRPLFAPPGDATRPTSDRLRETLFNVLTNGAVDRIAGLSFLDLYAGSGAVGIEALSRGASHVTFVEQAPAAMAVLKKNLAGLGIQNAGSTNSEMQPVVRFLKGCLKKAAITRFDTVFLDPPYELIEEYTATLTLLGAEGVALLPDSALVVAEHRKKTPLADKYGQLSRFRSLKQGDAALSFYQLVE